MLDSKLYGLEGKVVIVTGGGVGIGKGIALEMAKAGASIVIAELDPSRADTAVDEIRAIGSKALKVVADVTKSEQVDKMIKETLQEFGTIDTLVNNVGGLLGVTAPISLMETSKDYWDDTMNLNLTGTFLCTKAFVNVIIDQKKKGSIVNISSLSGQCADINFPPYAGAKAAIISLTLSMAVEMGKYNVRVNSIAPGRINTPLSEALYRDRQQVRKDQLKWIPVGRFGLPEDIGRVAVFLASDAAGYVSGQTIGVGGGLTHLFTYS